MQKILPCLWFNHQAEEAVDLYTSLFADSRILSISRYGENTPGQAGTVMTVNFELAGLEMIALNGGPEFSFTPAISFFVECQSEAEVDTLWNTLAQGGQVLMELGNYPFSPKFGWLADRYGISWQISLAGTPTKISPYLLFVGEHHGQAGSAIQTYVSLFNNSGIQLMQRFGPDMGEPEGTVMHARFLLENQDFIAMDSALDHRFGFTPAISFFVRCADQAEVDLYWESLLQNGEAMQCGWLTDRFGVTWQIVPVELMDMLADSDAARVDRVTQAMLKMVKLELEPLRQTYRQP